MIQEDLLEKAAWLYSVTQRLPIGTRVRILNSDIPEQIGRVGTVIRYDPGQIGDYPLVSVCLDNPTETDGFYDDEIVTIEE